jgi:glycosyltransferase involved in cell wall biosynthesis
MVDAAPRPRVTVCVVTYRHEAFIAECIASVLAQDADADVHVLIGDDCSPDGTAGVVERLMARFPGSITYFRHAQNMGPTANYRFLIERADGDFIAHLDGDDVWLPGKLARQLASMRKHPAASASFTNALVFDGEGEGKSLGFFSNALDGLLDMDALLRRGNFLNHSSLLYRACHKGAVLALPEPFLDYHIHVALCRQGPIIYNSAVLAGYRFNTATSVIRTTNDVVREQYWLALRDGLGSATPAIRPMACADFLRRVAFRAVRVRKLSLFTTWWRRCLSEVGVSAWSVGVALAYCVAAEAARQCIDGMP